MEFRSKSRSLKYSEILRSDLLPGSPDPAQSFAPGIGAEAGAAAVAGPSPPLTANGK